MKISSGTIQENNIIINRSIITITVIVTTRILVHLILKATANNFQGFYPKSDITISILLAMQILTFSLLQAQRKWFPIIKLSCVAIERIKNMIAKFHCPAVVVLTKSKLR